MSLDSRRDHTTHHGAHFTYLGEVSNEMAAVSVNFCEDVEEKGFHVKVQCLVVEEQLGEQTQVLTVNL